MSIWTSLEPASTIVDPGGTTTVRLRVRNTSDVVDEYRFIPVGEIAPYVTLEPPTLRLYPGTTGTVELTFAPPRSPDATAGPNPYAVQIIPTENPEATTVPEGNVTVTAFTEIRAELVPPTVRGRFRGRPTLAIDNLGNTRLTASVNGADSGGQLGYQVHPANVQVEPGRATFVKATLKPQRIAWFGRKENRPYQLSVLRSGSTPVGVDGIFVQKGVLPRWLAGFFGIGFGLAIALVALWFAYQPHVTTLTQAQAQSAVTPLPNASSSPLAAAPPPAAAPSSAPSAPSGASASPGGGQPGGGGPTSVSTSGPTNTAPAHFTIMNNWTGQCADLPNYGPPSLADPMEQFQCAYGSSDNQMWYLQQQGTAPDGEPLYWIRNALGSNLCLDLPDYGSAPSGSRAATFTCNTPVSADNQLWEIPFVNSSSSGGLGVLIRNYKDGLCLDVSGWAYNNSDKGSDAALGVYQCSGTGSNWADHGFDDHLWNLMESPSVVYIPTRVGEITVN